MNPVGASHSSEAAVTRAERDAGTSASPEAVTRLRRRALIAGGLAVLVLVAMSMQGEPIWDDPYILFRYGENLATGHGWSFNPYASTDNAVTSSLDVLLLAAGRVLGASIPPLAAALFFVTTWASAALTGLTLEKLGHRTAGLISAILLAVSPALTALWGMESSLYLCLLAGALYSATSRRSPWVTGLCIGLLALARPDGLLVGSVLIAVFFVVDRSRRLTLRGWMGLILGVAAPLVPWLIFSLAVLSSPLSSTLRAKIAQTQSGQFPGFLSRSGWEPTLLILHGGDSRMTRAFILVLVLAGVLGALAAIRSAWQLALTLGLSTVGICIAYGIVLNVPAYPWYYALPIYTVLVLAGLGIECAGSALQRWPTLRIAALTVVVLVLAVGSVRHINHTAVLRQDYAYIGEWLRRNTDPSATVASQEVGKIGWFSNRDMIDYLGLLDSRADDHVAKGDFNWWVSYYQPDYWVTNRGWIDGQFASSSCFSAAFVPVLSTSTLTIYQRIKPVPAPGSCP